MSRLDDLKAEHGEHKQTVEDTSQESQKKRGRPVGSKNKPRDSVSVPTIPPSIIRAAIKAPYDAYAVFSGKEHWKLSETELENMIAPHLELAQQYVPDYFQKHIGLYAVLTLHAMAIIIRIDMDNKLRKQAETETIDVTPLEAVSNEPNPSSGQTRFGQILHTAPPDKSAS